MKKEQMNNLVGKSFEELSLEEMEMMQGAANIEARSTPTVAVVATPEISEAVSVIASILTASVAATYAKKCSRK